MTQEHPPLDIYIILKTLPDLTEAKNQAELVKTELEKLASGFKLQISKNPRYTGAMTNKETYEKIFGAKVRYYIDPGYSATEKIWIQTRQPIIPATLINNIEEVGLDYW